MSDVDGQGQTVNNERKTMSESVYGEQATGRVTHTLLRLSTAMRSQAWEWAEGAGLTPTQGEILVLLMQRKGPMRLGEIARETALTAATTSDAVSTLETKGLVEKRRALDDGRALAVRLTARGRTAAKRAAQWPDFRLCRSKRWTVEFRRYKVADERIDEDAKPGAGQGIETLALSAGGDSDVRALVRRLSAESASS
jgi:DNA-binding MarR family transcriptional regulator